MLDHFFEQVTDVNKFTGGNDTYKEGVSEGKKDRIRDDVQKGNK
jgi:hypothetical protein